jgi:hypothetical protein
MEPPAGSGLHGRTQLWLTVLLVFLLAVIIKYFVWGVVAIAGLSVFFLLLFAGFCASPWEAWELTFHN